MVFVNYYFCTIFFTLKIFKKYSRIKQWDKSEYWAAGHQFVFVIIFLLIKNDLVIV